MKQRIKMLVLLCIFSHMAFAQQTLKASFVKNKINLQRKELATAYELRIKMDSNKINADSISLYSISIETVHSQSTLPLSAYRISKSNFALSEMKADQEFFLTINEDSAADRVRHLFLEVVLKKRGITTHDNVADSNIVIDISVEGRAVNSYNYLAYVGTNFDLVDGVKAQNLFFATNLLVPPQHHGEGFGFNLTLYGNRTLTLTDTSGRVNYVSKVVGIPGDSARFYREEALKTVTRVSDNLGATFSPLIRIGKVSEPGRKTQLYLAPQFEFIWRRTQITTTYTNNTLVDSFDRADRPITGTVILTPPNEVIPLNVYFVYLGGAGLYLNHENKDISIRVQASIGPSFSYTSISGNVKNGLNPMYTRTFNIYSFVRAWVTEPVSGITIGAEVSNSIGNANSYQPYYNVTLSKAISLNALGAIFKPVTTR